MRPDERTLSPICDLDKFLKVGSLKRVTKAKQSSLTNLKQSAYLTFKCRYKGTSPPVIDL
jgi:hypothetical protein